MNWLLIIVIATLIFYAWRGKERGFIRTVFTIFSTIVAILITMWISPYISKLVQSNDKVIEYVSENISEKFIFDDVDSTTTSEIDFIDKLPLPSLIKETLVENNTKDTYTAMAVDSFKGYVNHMLAMFIINIIVFLIVCLIVKILLHVVSSVLDLISRLPIINGLNRLAGISVGLLHGIIVVWIGFVVITVFGSSEIGQELFRQINESMLLTTIYNNNIILAFLVDLRSILF